MWWKFRNISLAVQYHNGISDQIQALSKSCRSHKRKYMHVVFIMRSFIAEFVYGANTVLVVQPLDTIKTLQQTYAVASASYRHFHKSSIHFIFIERSLCDRWDTNILYRGSSLTSWWRSNMICSVWCLQVNISNQTWLAGKITQPSDSIFLGVFDPQVIVVGFIGGIGWGMVCQSRLN